MVVIALAAIYAQEVMKFDFVQTMILVLVVNVTAAIGAFAFGYVQDALGHKLALGITLLHVAGDGDGGRTGHQHGDVLGGGQPRRTGHGIEPVGRTGDGGTVRAARDRLAEFYGLWTFATQLAAIIGPITYGAVVFATDNNHRLGDRAYRAFSSSPGCWYWRRLTLLGGAARRRLRRCVPKPAHRAGRSHDLQRRDARLGDLRVLDRLHA